MESHTMTDTPTARSLAVNIGRPARLTLPVSRALSFDVEILDVRTRFGNLDYLVRPIAGIGQTWHAAHMVAILD